ncbi:MAG: hypothetical protein ACI4XR_03710 [Bacilli bacterium]
MKKKFYIAILLCSIIFLGSCAVKSKYFKEQSKNENISFKEKYEDLNNQSSKIDKKYIYEKIEIDKNNKMVELSYDEVINLLDYGTGILIFTSPYLNECRKIIPKFIDFTTKVNENAYYYDLLNDKNESNLNYQKLTDKLDDYLLDNQISEPMILFIKEGNIIEYINVFDDNFSNFLKEKYETYLKA